MRWLLLRALIVFAFLLAELSAATFGTVVPVVGGVVDMVLDARRQRLYIVNVPDQIQVYSIPQRRFLTPIRTDSLPLSAAMSRDGSVLYVTAYNASSLNVIDLERLEVTRRVSLPARPEGVAVGADGKVLISTIGTGANNAQNALLVYDPSPGALNSILALTIAPAAPTPPQLPPPQGRVFLANRSQMMATEDGSFIIGMNIPTTNASNRVMFVYEAASNTVLRSRVVTGASSVLAIHPNGRTFMAGLTLFDTQTLE
nr:hypothetical protein [Bryobacter sp.]